MFARFAVCHRACSSFNQRNHRAQFHWFCRRRIFQWLPGPTARPPDTRAAQGCVVPSHTVKGMGMQADMRTHDRQRLATAACVSSVVKVFLLIYCRQCAAFSTYWTERSGLQPGRNQAAFGTMAETWEMHTARAAADCRGLLRAGVYPKHGFHGVMQRSSRRQCMLRNRHIETANTSEF